MADVIQFLPREARKRDAMIREARAIYEGIFPSEKLDQAAADATRPYVAPEKDPA